MSPSLVLSRLAGLVAVLTLSGCSIIGDVRRTPPASPAPAARATVPAAAPTVTVETLTADADVPAGFRRATVDFADARTGAALYTSCALPSRPVGEQDECSARLLVTVDGGATWATRAHPEPKADNHQLYVGRDGRLVLLAEPRAFYVSEDHGRTFTRAPGVEDGPPAAYRTLDGPFEVCCSGDEGSVLRRWVGVERHAVPAAPPVRGALRAVLFRQALGLWVASTGPDGRLYVAESPDGGRTWTKRPPDGPVEQVGRVQLLASADEADLWLVATAPDERAYSLVWFWTGDTWERVPADGPPAARLSAVALGGGLLAVTGPEGSGLLRRDALFEPTGWPNGWFRLLSDGAVQVTDPSGQGLWLGTGPGVTRRWTGLVLPA